MGQFAIHHRRTQQGPKGSVLFETSPDQTWVLDAGYLYRERDRLKPIGAYYALGVRTIDVASHLLLLGSLPGSFFLIWWSGPAMLILACLLRAAGKRMVAHLAAKAAQSSAQTLLYLYNTGALWLNQPTSPSWDREHPPQ